MLSTHQIAVEIANHPGSSNISDDSASQPGDYSIDIKAGNGWIITGQYHKNFLQGIKISKQAILKEENHGRN